MKWIVVFMLVFLMCPAVAAEVDIPINSTVTLTLSDAPCSNATILALLKPGVRGFYTDGYATYNGERLTLCWRISPDGQFLRVVDESGGGHSIPIIHSKGVDV